MLPRPRAPPTRFDIIGVAQKVEEETLVWYTPEDFYPVKIGETFKSRYRVVGKLGYGAYATVWLCKDIWYLVPLACGSFKVLIQPLVKEAQVRYNQSLQTRMFPSDKGNSGI